MLKTKHVGTVGHWRTLEWSVNRSMTTYFLAPAGGRIRLRVGVWIFAYTRQSQSLNGVDCKRLVVSSYETLGYARFQIRVPQVMDVTYDHYTGQTEDVIPELPCG